MTEVINHDLRVVDGGTLYMPPWEEGNDNWGNLKRPSVYEATTLQEYPTGTIWRHGLRTFIYTQMDPTYFGEYGAGTGAILAGYTVESCSEINTISAGVVSGTSGESTCILDLENGHAVDCYAGGFVGIVGSAGDRQTTGRVAGFQVITNTVTDSDHYSTFTLDGALPRTLATTDHVVLAEHPYAMVRHPDPVGPYGMTVGLLLQTTAASKFCWVQTGGPSNIVLTGYTFEGNAAYEVPVYAGNGFMNKATNGTNSVMGQEAGTVQRCGNSYANTNVDGPTTAGTETADTVSSCVWLDIFN